MNNMGNNLKNLKVARRLLLIPYGDTGLEACRRAQLLPQFNPRFTRIIAVNTDPDLCPQSLKGHFCALDKPRVQRIQANPQHYRLFNQHLRLWEIPALGNEPGTEQLICQGYLLFLASVPRLREKIELALRDLNSSRLLHRAEEEGYDLSDEIYVIVVRHCGGGTGSGPMSLIMSLVAQCVERVVNRVQEHNLIDLVLSPEPYIDFTTINKEKARANAGVFLDHKARNATLKYGEEWVKVEGCEGTDRLPLGVKPITFWLGNTNVSLLKGGRSFSLTSLDHAYDLLAEFITLFTSSSLIDSFYQTHHTLPRKNFIFGHPAFLSSYNYYVLEFDPMKIKEYLLNDALVNILERV